MAILSISKAVLLICGVAASSVPAPSLRPGTMRAAGQTADGVNWLEFDTDACGRFDRFETRDTAAKAVPASTPEDAGDDDEWVNGWDMSPSQSARLNDWLSEHPEIATVTSAIDKSCKDDAPSVLEDGDEPEIA